METLNNMKEANLKKVEAEIAKLIAETSKINRENVYYPLVVGSAFTIALGTILATFIKLFF